MDGITILHGALVLLWRQQGALFNDIMKDAFGDVQIEDLWIRYFCISTNVSKARMQVHQSGPLWKYCRASMTVRYPSVVS